MGCAHACAWPARRLAGIFLLRIRNPSLPRSPLTADPLPAATPRHRAFRGRRSGRFRRVGRYGRRACYVTVEAAPGRRDQARTFRFRGGGGLENFYDDQGRGAPVLAKVSRRNSSFRPMGYGGARIVAHLRGELSFLSGFFTLRGLKFRSSDRGRNRCGQMRSLGVEGRCATRCAT